MNVSIRSISDLTASGKKTQTDRKHALSVDVEDWFQVWALSNVIKREDWDSHSLRVEKTSQDLLDLFSEKDATCTFFILGWVAERLPMLIRRMVDEGHEIASHGWEHVKVFEQSPVEFKDDVLRTKSLLEDISGLPVKGYRAAGFSIVSRTPWAHEILAETGHHYSSSSHPISHDHYGDPNAPLDPYRVQGVLEIPVAVQEVMGRRQTCAGGGWFRAMPYSLSKFLWNRMDALDRKGVFYLHPWEIDPEQPQIEGLSMRSKFRHRLNLSKMHHKLSLLLDDFRWGRIDEVFLRQIETGELS